MKIRKECLPFFLPAWILSVVLVSFSGILSLLFLGLAIFIAYFFRDPERTAPETKKAILISPADGKVIINRKVTPEEAQDYQVPETSTKVSIFMNVFSVHVNRAPLQGKIIKIHHSKGKKMPAYHEKASKENEHMDFVIQGLAGEHIAFRLIAGLVAQRIVSFKQEGDIVNLGDKIGMIKFGSRVDVIVPAEYEVIVKLNEKIFAGETVLAQKA